MGYKARMYVEEVGQFIMKDEEYRKIRMKIRMVSDELIDAYKNFLTDEERCKARMIFWACESIEQYKQRFLVLVLMGSYRVWDESHKRYPELLKAVESNNPKWLDRVIKNHEFKISHCKVSVYPLEEALT